MYEVFSNTGARGVGGGGACIRGCITIKTKA